MRPEVARELVNSVRLARTLNRTGVVRLRLADRVPSKRDMWLAAAAESFNHGLFWLNHARDLKKRYGP